jgi:peptide/nickel transport system substrate-binding protein
MPGRPRTPERFLTTVVMTDIVGSTEHAAELGDSAWRELLQQHHALIRAELRRHGGREMDTAGDGFFVTFDAPATAVACVLAIAEGVGKLGIEIRAGVHAGEVEQMGAKVTGLTVVIASRIMANAGGGEVLVSSTVRDLAAGSGLGFDDRGVRQLKGVPGEWHVYSVGRAQPESVEGDAPATARKRRAAAVRRAQSRPIWQRRPRVVAAIAAGLALLLATSGVVVWRPWQPAALASVTENSIGVIDPARDEVVGEIPVGTRPGGIAVGDASAWVTNTGADSVSQIDLGTRRVVIRIDVGRDPTGIAVAEGSAWVANSGERTVSRIDTDTARLVQTIEVGNGPTAIVAAGALLWVANATDSTVVSIDARTGEVGEPIGVGATPIALAVDEGGLWVVSEDGASVSHLDPVTGATVAPPIQLSARPSAIALDEGSVWVASADGTVTRIERAAHRVTATIDVGASLTAIVISGNAIWVGDRDGNVYRLVADHTSSPPKRISTSSAVGALAAVDGEVWLAGQASAASHRGGTLRIVQFNPDDLLRYDTDPLANPFYNVTPLEADGLVAYRHVGGTAGSALLPDLATSVPRPTNGGLTYTFQLRPNLQYSTGEPVRASDFRRALERSFQAAGIWGVWGAELFSSIVGADVCANDDGTPVERCDLSQGIVTDDAAKTVTFNLSAPDPEFVYRLANAVAYPVPEGAVPMNELLDGATFPGTGPYTVSEVTENEIRLARNPRFQEWDAAVRPDGFPKEIVFTIVGSDEERIAMVENGDADYTSCSGLACKSPELFGRIKTLYPGQWHVGSSATSFVNMNSSIPPFDKIEARQAVNFAIDRAHMADLAGGPPDAAITCQLLPPTFPGYQPYCPYTLHPDGHWTAPDMEAAQQLVDESGTRGAQVILGPTFPQWNDQLTYLGSVLEELGYQVSIHTVTDVDELFNVWATQEPGHISINGWGPDWLSASNFLGILTCNGDPLGLINYCDPAFDAAFMHARELQATDPAAAAIEWTALDHRGVDLAILAPLLNAGADFVSERVGNYQFTPMGAVLFDQMWVQ